ncbi:hypothetical protein DRJ17_06625 [Candidatus Woesearchaeota archaeon]|nr:MAG: hypothetical protein DRJ17_06625 [Candidatus Woesearchaeota archaeon]
MLLAWKMFEEKETELEEDEKKKEKKPTWQKVPPTVLVAGIVAIVLVWRSMIMTEEKGQYVVIIVGILIIFYILSRRDEATTDLVTPKEAELLVEREAIRKKAWGQFPLMATPKIGPLIDIQHRDGAGLFYRIGVTIIDPYRLPKYYIGKVMMKGPERGFTTLIEPISPFTGREGVAEKSLLPSWVKAVRKDSFLEKFFSSEK